MGTNYPSKRINSSNTTRMSLSKSSIIILPFITLLCFTETCCAFLQTNISFKSISSSILFKSKNPITLQKSTPPKTTQLYATSNNKDSHFENNKKRTCIELFLTQRSIQSFMFLCEECRDPHTADWVERFLDSTNLLEYHGTGAFNMTQFPSWDTFFLNMLQEPPAKIIIQARRRGAGRGGWSKNNPYLQDRFVEYNVDIDPASVASRIMSVREQIAREWTQDFDLVVASNDQILTSYVDKMMDARENEDDSMTKLYTSTNQDGSQSSAFDKDKSGMQIVNLLDAKIALDGYNSTPFRKGSFDLLLLLTLHESIHRVLRSYQELGSDKEVSFLWLREFYSERVNKYFDGNGKYGRANDFLEELLLTPPAVKTFEAEKKVGLIDPLRVAEEIIKTRSDVAMEWKRILEYVPDYHIQVKKSLMSRRMADWSSQEVSNSSSLDESDAFQ